MSLDYQLRGLLAHNRDGSYATQRDRSRTLARFLRGLKAAGLGLKKLANLKPRHIAAGFAAWRSAGLSAGTLKNHLAHLRWFCGKLGKPELLPSDNDALGVERRSQVTGADKSWPDAFTEPALAQVRRFSETLYWQMRAMEEFGLRFREAACLRPHENDQGERVEVRFGTKGGRRRFVPVLTPAQRSLLDALKERLPRGLSMTPPDMSFKQWQDRAYGIAERLGLSKETRTNFHALRHRYAQGRHRQLLAEGLSDREARKVLAEELGHGRADVVANYLGGPPAPEEAA